MLLYANIVFKKLSFFPTDNRNREMHCVWITGKEILYKVTHNQSDVYVFFFTVVNLTMLLAIRNLVDNTVRHLFVLAVFMVIVLCRFFVFRIIFLGFYMQTEWDNSNYAVMRKVCIFMESNVFVLCSYQSTDISLVIYRAATRTRKTEMYWNFTLNFEWPPWNIGEVR